MEIAKKDSIAGPSSRCLLKMDDQIVVAANQVTARRLGAVNLSTRAPGSVVMEFSQLQFHGQTSFTLEGIATAAGYEGVATSSTYLCNGQGTWSLTRLDSAGSGATLAAEATKPSASTMGRDAKVAPLLAGSDGKLLPTREPVAQSAAQSIAPTVLPPPQASAQAGPMPLCCCASSSTSTRMFSL